MIALLTGPLQFIKSFAQKIYQASPNNRRVYMGCVLIGGTSGLYLAIFIYSYGALCDFCTGFRVCLLPG
jgi:hypothetical protein